MRGWPIKNTVILEVSEDMDSVEEKISRYLCEKFQGEKEYKKGIYRKSINYREFAVKFDNGNSIEVTINQPQPDVYVVKLLCGVIYTGERYEPEGFIWNGKESKVEKEIRELFE
ncbi:MAG TPA: hypothetical protein ENF95_00830 [Candidatus Aenigmarchaeota archaeon]|nr:hypothetical protein [Candidatus Aenigmarchaeota archaeon]